MENVYNIPFLWTLFLIIGNKAHEKKDGSCIMYMYGEGQSELQVEYFWERGITGNFSIT